MTAANGAHPDIPLLLARSAGFMGLLRVQLREHCSTFRSRRSPVRPSLLSVVLTSPARSSRARARAVVDTHPSSLAALRIDSPFDELAAAAAAVDYAALDSMEHANVPFVLILVRALAEWRKTVRLSSSSVRPPSPLELSS